jgi:hypothetical protein
MASPSLSSKYNYLLVLSNFAAVSTLTFHMPRMQGKVLDSRLRGKDEVLAAQVIK